MTPKQLKPLPGEEPRTAFAGDNPIDPDDYTRLDRSTLENWAKCPAMAAWIASGKVNTSSDIANAGEEVHKAFSYATQEWIDADGQDMSQRDLREAVDSALRHSRPDVQPEAIQAARASVYAWARFIRGTNDGSERGINPDNILHFDNGEGARCGQLAYDIPDLQCRPTSEVDFVISTSNPKMLYEIDYKSGRKLWTREMVKTSFQFSFHAVLIFKNYESVDGLNVQMWNTRTNRRSFSYMFRRENLPRYEARAKESANAWYQYHTLPPEICPTWPSVEKCKWCAAAHKCPASGREPVEDETAEDVLLRYIAMSEKLGRLKSWLTEYADKHGDIKTKGGDCFGRVAVAKPTAKTYKEND